MAVQLFADFASSTISNGGLGVLATDTVINLLPGTGSRFPIIAAGSGNYFYLVLYQKSGAYEINHKVVKVTGITVDQLALSAAVGIAYNDGDPVELRWLNESVLDERSRSDGLSAAASAAAVAAAATATSATSILTPAVTPIITVLGSAITAAHGLGFVPASVVLEYTCLTAEGGYSAGDVVMMPTGTVWNGTVGGQIPLWKNTTTVGFQFPAGYSVGISNKTTSVAFTPTAANWSSRFRIRPQ